MRVTMISTEGLPVAHRSQTHFTVALGVSKVKTSGFFSCDHN